jgi:hypothetical protein
MKMSLVHGHGLALAALLAAGCNSDDPSAPTPATQPPVTAAPAPTPAPTPAAFRCPLPDMPRLDIICPRPAPVLSGEVDAAIDKAVREHPQLFDTSQDKGGGSYKVLDRARYHEVVVANLHARNVCAIIELEEIAVKTTNEYNEQYNIWTSDGFIRHGRGAHITTCFPATF